MTKVLLAEGCVDLGGRPAPGVKGAVAAGVIANGCGFAGEEEFVVDRLGQY